MLKIQGLSYKEVRHNILPCLQKGPVNPAGHIQVKLPSTPSLQVPPFKQGLLRAQLLRPVNQTQWEI